MLSRPKAAAWPIHSDVEIFPKFGTVLNPIGRVLRGKHKKNRDPSFQATILAVVCFI
jgi:hypothetical protein